METQEEKKKPIPKRLYVSCPVCGNVIMQAEAVKNAILKCDNCRQRITVEVDGNKVVTLAPTEK